MDNQQRNLIFLIRYVQRLSRYGSTS